jgi:hypothetical protein
MDNLTDMYERISMTLVGGMPREASVVMTPIRSIFARFRDEGWLDIDHGGWWPRLRRDGVHVVLIPQGGAVADLCRTLAASPRVDFLGFGGALSASLAVGQIVRPDAVRRSGSTDTLCLSPTTLSPATPSDVAAPQTLVTVSHLLETYDSAAGLVADVADMETWFAASALNQVGGTTLAAHLVITDRWPDAPFYDQDANAGRHIRSSCDLFVQMLAADLRGENGPT